MRFTLLITIALLMSCTSSNNDGLGPENTITTESGLQYYYLKKGDGRMIEKGSIVETKLSLLVEDELIWTSYEAEDSLFTFIAGVSGVIDGFEEMAFLMREGDNVVAMLPYDIAYGEDGAGDDIPPYATLVYDRYEIVLVSEPKKVLADTLTIAFSEAGTEGVREAYESIIDSELSDQYHTDLDLLQPMFGEMRENKQFDELFTLAEYFSTKATSDFYKALMGYYQVVALEEQDKFDQAIQLTNQYLGVYPDDQWFQARLVQLQEAKANAD